MKAKTLNTLEYNKIIEMLAEKASSVMAKDRLRKLRPMTDAFAIREALAETTEAACVMLKKGVPPLGKIYDIGGSVSFACKGGSLTMGQLLAVLYDLKVAADVIAFLRSDLPELPIIDAIREVIQTFPRLADNIDRCILSEDEMADSASPRLRSIRRSIALQNDAIRNRINSILNSAENKTYLRDAIVTIRGGRYVIPVKAEHRSRFAGIVHDQSSTGATLFIEPQVIVNMNNELRELELAEQAEVARILAELSSAVAEHGREIMNNQKLLTELDIIFAKGKLSAAMNGEEPSVEEGAALDLRQARHPLIEKKKVVPISVKLGDDYHTLVVTGPNTGGKTVTLKTVGLLCLMAQSGLHIPAASTSRLPVFGKIFADIGDEQSIEQSLSTFSSHMKNIVSILKDADEDSLVLLDELGAGTDPAEGAALAISVLERLAQKGSRTIATTHYNELKKYALSTTGVENGSMEFDVATLSPTYRLFTGIPGRSNAFEISRKLGLDESLIERAGQRMESRDAEFEDLLAVIEEDRKKAACDRQEAEALRAAAEDAAKAAEDRRQRLEKKEQEILGRAREEAQSMIREAKNAVNQAGRELRKLQKSGLAGRGEDLLNAQRERLRQAESGLAVKTVERINQSPVSADKLKIGDRVRILSLGQTGEILSLPDSKGNLTVKVGNVKAAINADDLAEAEGSAAPAEKAKGRYGGLYREKAQTVSTSVNVQGSSLDDAEMTVDKYLDDAYMAGLKEVVIIHGKGEGILRDGLRKLLRKHRLVASFRRGGYNEGGEGVTVVTLKE